MPKTLSVASFRSATLSRLLRRAFMLVALSAIAALPACSTVQQHTAVPQATMMPPAATAPGQSEQSSYLRLPGMAAKGTSVRVGIILPFSNSAAATRKLAASMMNAAQMALYDSGHTNIVLITGDEGDGGAQAASAAQGLIRKGVRVIIGPLFAASVRAVAPVAQQSGIPVIGFSSDRSVAAPGVYLLSFQPENDVRRIVDYAASQGHRAFAALLPRNAYGDHIAAAFERDVPQVSGQVVDIERFDPQNGDVAPQAVSLASAHPDALLVAQGGAGLRGTAQALSIDGLAGGRTQLLGTGIWDDTSILGEQALDGGWFAAPQPDANSAFVQHYQAAFGSTPPTLSSLAYDAVALVGLLSERSPGERFSARALTNPNGFAGVSGIFRFDPDGDCQRGLAILGVSPGGFTVVAPAPTTFQRQGS